jgi:hypothetical protein
MSLADLRKELKDARKSAMPVPVSRMKKSECAAELERLKGIHHKEVAKVEAVMEKAEVPKKVAKVVKEVQEKAHAKGEEAIKKTKSVKAPKEAPKKEEAKKPAKGSDAMREKMARLRAMRKEKKGE